MKDDSDKKDEQNTAPTFGREFAARRTIVKGIASAVPVVMTIGCGQAMAQTSSLRCIIDPVPMPAHCINNNQTENPIYVRESATQSECMETDPNSTSRSGSELYGDKGMADSRMSGNLSSPSVYGGKGGADPRMSQWAGADPSQSNSLSGGTAYGDKGSSDTRMQESGFGSPSNSANKQRLVYVDSNGNPTTSNNGLPVTASCYASFVAVTSRVSFDAFGNKGSRG